MPETHVAHQSHFLYVEGQQQLRAGDKHLNERAHQETYSVCLLDKSLNGRNLLCLSQYKLEGWACHCLVQEGSSLHCSTCQGALQLIADTVQVIVKIRKLSVNFHDACVGTLVCGSTSHISTATLTSPYKGTL